MPSDLICLCLSKDIQECGNLVACKEVNWVAGDRSGEEFALRISLYLSNLKMRK